MTNKSIHIIIPGTPTSGSQLKFNRKTGNAYRPTGHKQRVFTISEYCRQWLVFNGYSEIDYKEYPGTFQIPFGNGIPVRLQVEFYFPYRKADYRTGKNSHELKKTAPKWVIGNKDLDNILKPLKDGIKGLLIADDNQVVHYSHILKMYSEYPRTEIWLEEMN